MEILSWRFRLNKQGKYDIYEEREALGNWIYITTVQNIEDVWK